MKIIFLTILGWISVHFCLGQDANRKNALTLSYGTSYLMRQDLIFSPFIHKDFSFLNIGLNYTKEAKCYQKVGFRYGGFNPMVSKPYEFIIDGDVIKAYPHSFHLIDLDYLLGKKIRESTKSNLTAGGLFSVDVQAMSYVHGRFSNFGYYSRIGIGIFGSHQYRINEKSKIITTLQLPIMSWLARSPYLVNDDEFIENISSHSGLKTFLAFIGDGQLATWNRMQTLDLEFKYEYNVSQRWELGAAYQFELIHVSRPRNLLSYRNSLNIFSNFRF